MTVNSVTGDPTYLSDRNDAIAAASSIGGLVEALDLGGDDDLVAAAQQADAFLPGAVVQAVLAAYKGGAASGTDVVHLNWVGSGGFSARVAQAPGSDPVEDQGVVSVTVKSPKLGS
jgi:hypothetical protein